MSNDWRKIEKFALGLIGGYLLIEILKNLNRCKSCGNQIPANQQYCPYCGGTR